MIDKKKIRNAARDFCKSLEKERKAIQQAELNKGANFACVYIRPEVAFKAGINWFLDNIKHNSNEKPKVGEEVFIQLYEDKSWHSALFNGYDFDVNDMNKESEYSVQPIEITRWFYIDDLLKGGK